MKNVRARRPVIFLAFLFWALYTDHTGLVRIGLLAAVLHECGHVLVWMALTRTLPVLQLSAFGIGLEAGRAKLGPGKTFLLAAAGPLMNFLLCGLTLLRMNQRATYWGFFFAAANGLLGLFNLLPVGKLDGKQMWRILAGWGLHLLHK